MSDLTHNNSVGEQDINDDNFEKEVLQSSLPVLVDFWAPWCGPCRQFSPIVDEVAQELSGKIAVMKLNIDENPSTPTKYGVRSIPTVILFKDGKASATRVGSTSKSDLLEWVKSSVTLKA